MISIFLNYNIYRFTTQNECPIKADPDNNLILNRGACKFLLDTLSFHILRNSLKSTYIANVYCHPVVYQ